MENDDKSIADAVELKLALNDAVSTLREPRPSSPVSLSLATCDDTLQSNITDHSIIEPPVTVDTIDISTDQETFIKEKVDNIVDLPDQVKHHNDLIVGNENRSVVEKTQQHECEKAQTKKLGLFDSSKVYFIDQIEHYNW